MESKLEQLPIITSVEVCTLKQNFTLRGSARLMLVGSN